MVPLLCIQQQMVHVRALLVRLPVHSKSRAQRLQNGGRDASAEFKAKPLFKADPLAADLLAALDVRREATLRPVNQFHPRSGSQARAG